MSILLKNAILFDLETMSVEQGELVIDNGMIMESVASADEVIDCGGAVVMPGLVNGHTHLYSALAVGMPPPAIPPGNFMEILERIWWKLDRALDAETIELSARVGAMHAIRSGTTTLIDHHSSPQCIDGSLDLIERGLDEVGVRGVLCYETTDRNGREGRDLGLRENRSYIAKRLANPSHRFAGLVGAHASFTLDDESLERVVALASASKVGVHIHVAEDVCDEAACHERHGVGLIDRLEMHGLLLSENIFAHCIHLDERTLHRLNDSGVSVAHNPRSNMNNAVGYARVDQLRSPPLLGTDGIGADMFAEAQHAWFKSRDAGSSLTPNQVLGMLRASARRASQSLGVTLGSLQAGAAADVVITDYKPVTPLSVGNVAGHFLFAMSARNVKDVLVDGKWVLRDREDASGYLNKTLVQDAARRLWHRM